LEPLSDLLKKFIKEKGFEKNLQKSRLKQDWEEIAGKTFAEHLKIVKFEQKRLVLVASDPGWSHQASLIKHDLKKKINSYFGNQVVKEIRIKN